MRTILREYRAEFPGTGLSSIIKCVPREGWALAASARGWLTQAIITRSASAAGRPNSMHITACADKEKSARRFQRVISRDSSGQFRTTIRCAKKHCASCDTGRLGPKWKKSCESACSQSANFTPFNGGIVVLAGNRLSGAGQFATQIKRICLFWPLKARASKI